eukprot:TRINITY_DN318_c0_g1_i1.p1 TRINITY_DN318_c0_g1~~TRINITY_DN318_c0_g1_i1.p1  ORF type:complete len:365 (+),score=15.60 TRINITY_DN318_c0_g1_i1:73-1095(+)
MDLLCVAGLSVGVLALLAFVFEAIWIMGRPRIGDLKGKHVMITGGSHGIGFQMAKQALEQQAYVSIIARSADKLSKAVQDLQRITNCSSDRIFYTTADIANYEQISKAVNAANAWRPIDVLICNAGINRAEYLEKMTVADIDWIVQINLNGTIYTVHAALPHMKSATKQNPKCIMIVASLSTLYTMFGHVVCTTVKYAQRGLAETLRLELMPYNIGVGMACPGATDTPMLKEALGEMPPELMDMAKAFKLYQEGMVEKPQDVAKYTLDGVKSGSFISTSTMPGSLLATLTRGVLPADSFCSVFMELILYLPLRFFSFFMAGFTPILMSRFAPPASDKKSQ